MQQLIAIKDALKELSSDKLDPNIMNIDTKHKLYYGLAKIIGKTATKIVFILSGLPIIAEVAYKFLAFIGIV